MFDNIRLDCSFNLTGIDKKQELTSPLLKFYLLNITRRRRGEDSSLLYNNKYTVFVYFLSTVLVKFCYHPNF